LVATLHEFTSRTFKGRCRLLVSLYPCVRILSVNPQDRAALQGMAPRLVPRLRHLPVGATLFPYRLPRSEADAFRRDQGWERRFPILTYFGVLRPTKGIEELVVAFGIVRRKFPDALLLLLGHADEEFLNGRLLPMLDQEGVRDAVYLAGRCTEDTLSRYLAVTDLCALPYPDGLSPRRTSFMAALQAEQAIVTTTPLFPFAEIRDNENVLLVPVGVPGALAEGIVRVAVDAALCGRLRRGAAGLKAVFRWDRIVAEALAVFEEAVALASCRATMGSKA
jgi:glycosyltransferase involved in cell wall biosynthesis